MTPPSWAGIITACAAVFTAIALVITAIGGLMRSRKSERQLDQAERKIDQVHIIVNQQRTDMQRYIRAQTALLVANGIEPPIDQSIDTREGTS